MADGDGDMETMAIGSHVMHTKAGCGTLKSVHMKGVHEGYGGELEANTANPIGKVAMHDDDHEETGEVKAFPMAELKAHAETKAMAEGSGTAGGYTVKPEDEEKAAEIPVDDDTKPGGEPDGDFDADDMDEGENEDEFAGFKKGMHVRMKAPHYKGVGVVMGTYNKGHVPNVEEDIRATPDEPAARVKAYKAMGDGHEPTSHHVGVMCKHMTPLPEPLKPPTKKAKAAEPAPVRKTKAAPAIEPLPPLVALTEEQMQARILKSLDDQKKEAARAAVAEMQRLFGVV